MTTNVEELIKLSDAELDERVAAVSYRVHERMDRARDEERDLSRTEERLTWEDRQKLSALKDAIEARSRGAGADDERIRGEVLQRSRQVGEVIEQAKGRGPRNRGHAPVLVSEEHLRSHATAIREGRVFGAVEDFNPREVYERANVTVATDMGSPGAWGSGGVRPAVTLREFAQIPNTPLTGATAQMPSVTLPVAAAGVTEAAAAPEYDTIDVLNLSGLRYGRWTQVTSFVDAFDQLEIINTAHGVGIARDLNLADITAIQTAAGTVTAFSAALLDQNVRTAIMKVAAAALIEPEGVVLFGTSIALGVVNGYAPASGNDRGSVSTRIFGARVYVSESALAGNVYAFAPTGFRTFSDRLYSASTIDPTNGMVKFGQWIHSTPAGVAIVGAAAGVDCVTP
jgi:hypothetical protein